MRQAQSHNHNPSIYVSLSPLGRVFNIKISKGFPWFGVTIGQHTAVASMEPQVTAIYRQIDGKKPLKRSNHPRTQVNFEGVWQVNQLQTHGMLAPVA